LGLRAGVALKHGTPVAALEEATELADQVLVLGVNPGWGGQAFIAGSTERIARIAAMARAAGRAIEIGVDGGINATTAPAVVAAGATVLIAGSAVFAHPEGVAAGLAAMRAALP